MKELLCRLTAIEYYLKTIHYRSKGENFWSDHIFADKLIDDISGFKDTINEVCFLGEGLDAPLAADILKGTLAYLPEEMTEDMFTKLSDLYCDTLEHIEDIGDCSSGEKSLLDSIAQALQLGYGLILRRIR